MKITNRIAEIESQLFTVLEQPLVAQNPTIPITDANGKIIGKHTFNAPTMRSLYRSTGGNPLGTIGKRFNVIQPQLLFDNLLKCIGEIKDVDVDKLSYRELKDGSKIQFRVQLDPISFTNRAKQIDDIETFATLTTGYDGLTKTSFTFETFRLWCANGCSHKESTMQVSVKNTKRNEATVTNLCDDLAKFIKGTEDRGEWFRFLDSIDLTEIAKNRVIKAAIGVDRNDHKAEALSTVKLATLEEIEASIQTEVDSAGGTMWALFNGITRYTTHGGKDKNSQERLDYMHAGSGASMVANVEKTLAELVR